MMQPSLGDMFAAHVAASGYIADPEQQRVVDGLAAIKAALETEPAPRGLLRRRSAEPGAVRGAYIWGDVGRGKSMIMNLFFSSVDVTRKRRVHFHRFMQDIHRQLHAARGAGAADPLMAAADAYGGDLRLLAIDEMEITEIADAVVIGRVLERLLSNGTSLVMTSNRAPHELYRGPVAREVFQRFVKLIEDGLTVWHLRGEVDYRQHATHELPNYLTPLDDAARATLDDLWHRLGGDDAPVKFGRSPSRITVRSNGSGALRGTFADLCARPLSIADYMEVIGRGDVLLIDDIPCLSARQHNEARRLILLADLLYEAGHALAVSAEDCPERIYADPDGAGALAFGRTASRLREMTSRAWPARSRFRGSGQRASLAKTRRHP
jgi:cell division protein ZapE